MYFKSTEKRIFWLTLLTYVGIDFLLSIILSWYFDSNFFLVLILVILFFQVLIPLLYFIRSLLYWAVFYRVISKNVSDAFYSELISNKFPEPRDTESSVGEYFDYVASHNVVNKKALLLSMFYIGYIKCLNDSFSLIHSSALTVGLELSIKRYKEFLHTNPHHLEKKDNKLEQDH